MTEPTDILRKLRRPPDSHKGHFGHVLVLGGSTGFAGAACLAAEAALRGGAGLVTLGVPAPLLPVAATKLTACMTRPFRATPDGAFALGAVADVAMAGLSLGAATTLGATIGGAASGGWRPLWRKVENRLNGVQELTVEDPVLLLLADHLLDLARALEQRGHAAQDKLRLQEIGRAHV